MKEGLFFPKPSNANPTSTLNPVIGVVLRKGCLFFSKFPHIARMGASNLLGFRVEGRGVRGV